jgi:hypothetical protein
VKAGCGIDRGGHLKSIRIRQIRYVNNRIGQDHRRIKRRIRCMLGFKSEASAAGILAGIDAQAAGAVCLQSMSGPSLNSSKSSLHNAKAKCFAANLLPVSDGTGMNSPKMVSSRAVFHSGEKVLHRRAERNRLRRKRIAHHFVNLLMIRSSGAIRRASRLTHPWSA